MSKEYQQKMSDNAEDRRITHFVDQASRAKHLLSDIEEADKRDKVRSRLELALKQMPRGANIVIFEARKR